MITKNVIKKQRSHLQNSEYYIYYDGWYGEIINVRRSVDETCNTQFIKSSSEFAYRILTGQENRKKFIVSYDEENNLDIMRKDEILRLRPSDSKLYEIPKSKSKNWDIRARVYTKNSKLLIEINPLSIKKLTQYTFRKQVLINNESDLTLYIIKNNFPDYLIDIVPVDPVELLEHGFIVYDIADISKHVGFSDVSLMTRRCFEHYKLEIINSELVIAQSGFTKNQGANVKTVKHHDVGHIELKQTGNKLTVRANITPDEFYDLGLFEEKLPLYIVGETQDHYIDVMYLDVKALRKLQEINYTGVDFNIYDYNFLYKKPKLTIATRKPND
jgi:hypothetical protein